MWYSKIVSISSDKRILKPVLMPQMSDIIRTYKSAIQLNFFQRILLFLPGSYEHHYEIAWRGGGEGV